MKTGTRRWILIAGVLLGLCLLAGHLPTAKAAPSAAITLPSDYIRIDVDPISTPADDANSGAGGVCTLRDALAYVDSSGGSPQGCSGTTVGTGGPYVIMLPTGGYLYTLVAASLGHTTNDLYIIGDTAANTIIQASSDDPTDGGGVDYRVLSSTGGALTLSNLTLRYGQCAGGCVGPQSGGGLYLSAGTITLDNVIVTHNKVNTDGGGIYAQSSLSLTDSTVSGNEAENGGGIYASDLNVQYSTISGNLAGTGGGVLYNGTGPGAIFLNSTISSNTGRFNGGGIFNGGKDMTLYSSTVTNNLVLAGSTSAPDGVVFVSYPASPALGAAGLGGGIYTGDTAGPTSLFNTILAGNTALASGPDCHGPLSSHDYNLIGDTSDCTITGTTTHDITGVSANLGSLANNGGPTQTHALNSGSPAIDGGDPAGCTDGSGTLPNDQRLYTRPVDGDGNGTAICDIGAYEYQPAAVSIAPTPNVDVTLTASVDPASANVGDTVFWTFVIHNPGTQGTAGLTFRADLPSNLTYVNLTTTSGQLRTPMTLPTIWVDMPGIPPGEDVTIVIETTVNALSFNAPPIRARIVGQAVKAVRHLLQSASACVQGSVATVGAQACLTVLPAELPETGGQPVSPAPWIAAVLAAILLTSGGLLLRRRLVNR